jgi:hypothetical protein
MKIEVLEMRLLNNGDKTLKAFCDVLIDRTTMREFRVIKDLNKAPRVVAPQLSWKDPSSGNIFYKTIITLPEEVKGEVDRIILNHYSGEKEKRDAEKSK